MKPGQRLLYQINSIHFNNRITHQHPSKNNIFIICHCQLLLINCWSSYHRFISLTQFDNNLPVNQTFIYSELQLKIYWKVRKYRYEIAWSLLKETFYDSESLARNHIQFITHIGFLTKKNIKTFSWYIAKEYKNTEGSKRSNGSMGYLIFIPIILQITQNY